MEHRGFGPLEWLICFALALIWGSSFLWIAIGVDALSPAVVAFGRVLAGAIVLGCFPASRRPVEPGDWPKFVALGVSAMGVPLLLFAIAEEHVPSAIAGMINGATPITTAAVSVVFFAGVMNRRLVIGLLVGFAGVVCIALPSVTGESPRPLSIAMLLGAITCYGFALNLAVPMQSKYGSLGMWWRAQLVALLVLVGPMCWGMTTSRLQWSSVGAVIVLGVAGTGFAYVLMGELVGRVGSVRASITLYFTPVVAVALGVVFRDETIAVLAIAGTVLVTIGAVIASRREVRVTSD